MHFLHVIWNCQIHRIPDHQFLTTVTNNAVTSNATSNASWDCHIQKIWSLLCCHSHQHCSHQWCHFTCKLKLSENIWSPASHLKSPAPQSPVMPLHMQVETVRYIEHLITGLSPQVTSDTVTSDATSHASWNCQIYRTSDHHPLITVTDTAITSDFNSRLSWNCQIHRTSDRQPLLSPLSLTPPSSVMLLHVWAENCQICRIALTASHQCCSHQWCIFTYHLKLSDSWIQKHKRLKRMLFDQTKQDRMQILRAMSW